MNTNFFIPLALAFALAALPLARGAGESKPADPVADEPGNPTDRWTVLKGFSYDERESLFAGLPELEAWVDAQISELAAKRATMDADNTSTKDWDFAMQEMGRARTNLKSTSTDLTKATREAWDQLKEKVGLAWVRTQNAYAKVKASTTN